MIRKAGGRMACRENRWLQVTPSVLCTRQSLQGTRRQQQISLARVALSAVKVCLCYPQFCTHGLTAGTETISHVFVSRGWTDGLLCHCKKVILVTRERGIHLAFCKLCKMCTFVPPDSKGQAPSVTLLKPCSQANDHSVLTLWVQCLTHSLQC